MGSRAASYPACPLFPGHEEKLCAEPLALPLGRAVTGRWALLCRSARGRPWGRALSAVARCYAPQVPRELVFKDLTAFVVVPAMGVTSL